MNKRRFSPRASTLGLSFLVLLCLSCAGPDLATPTATPDIPALETQVASKLAATLTAKAPTVTRTPRPTRVPPEAQPTPTATWTPTPEPSPTSVGAWLAFVRVTQDQVANILLYNTVQQEDEVLTHFVEPLNMSDLSWSKDGQWLLFVSAHDYLHSRSNERNAFMMRPDGTGLRMITGDYVDPAEAPGPYVTLEGRVVGGQGPCLVCAQGAASSVMTDEGGSFELPGVPVFARWARAVCQNSGIALQGDMDLAIKAGTTTPISITVEARGQGWTQASLSRDNRLIVGNRYQWALDKEGKQQYRIEGSLQDLEIQALTALEIPTDTTLIGLDWSPVADEAVGALTGAKAAWIWRWDAQGKSLGALIEMVNPEQDIQSASNPVWSPDGRQLAFALRHWLWWGGDKYKTEILVAEANGQNLRTPVIVDWGLHATNPSWATDGRSLYYQLAKADPSDPHLSETRGDIWVVMLADDAVPTAWTQDGVSYLPAASPPRVPGGSSK